MKQHPHAARGHNVRVDVQGVCDDVLVAFLGGSQLGFVFPLSHFRRFERVQSRLRHTSSCLATFRYAMPLYISPS